MGKPQLEIRSESRFADWSKDRGRLFFVALVLIHLAPIWWFSYFPSQDGPDHLQNARILLEYNDPDREILRQYYTINKSLSPNWFMHLILAGLMAVLPALAAEKVLLTGFIILFPLSVRYALGAINPRSKFLAALAFPFIYNSLFHFGFYSFCYSLPLYFFTLGYWIKQNGRFTIGSTLKLALLVLLLYFSHPTSFVTAALATAFLSVWPVLLGLTDQVRRRQVDLSALFREAWPAALATLCAYLPAMALLIVFLIEQGTERLPPWPFMTLLSFLRYMSLISFSEVEGWFGMALCGLFAITLLYLLALKIARREASHWDGLLVVAAGYLYMYFTAPRALAGGTLIEQRLLLYPFFALLLWFGAQKLPRLAGLAVSGLAAALAVTILGFHTVKYAELNAYLKEYLSGMHLIELGKTVLPLCLSHKRLPGGQAVTLVVSPFLHAGGYVAAQMPVVALNNHEADTSHFPTQYRPEMNPNDHIGYTANKGTLFHRSSLEAEPPLVDFLSYEKKTGGRVDYVLVWGAEKAGTPTNARTALIYQQLQQRYELIHTSPRWGFMQLFKIKD